MRRLLVSCALVGGALATAWLLAGLLHRTSAGEPIYLAGPPPQAPVAAPNTSPGPRPTLSLEFVEPKQTSPKLGAIVPATYLPIAPRTAPNLPAIAPNLPASGITISETIERTVIMPDAATKVPQSRDALWPTAALPPSGQPAAFPRAEPALKRKSYVDLSAAPCFAHAPDYNWIYGVVEYSSVAKEWRLRYASVDETDRYGGRVSLIENHQASLLRDGMYVHVRGHVVNPENNSNGPTYFRIDWYRTIDNPNSEQPADSAPVLANESLSRPKLLGPVDPSHPEIR
jgi:hypothetical protein